MGGRNARAVTDPTPSISPVWRRFPTTGLHEFVESDDAREGNQAFVEERKQNFAPYRASVSR